MPRTLTVVVMGLVLFAGLMWSNPLPAVAGTSWQPLAVGFLAGVGCCGAVAAIWSWRHRSAAAADVLTDRAVGQLIGAAAFVAYGLWVLVSPLPIVRAVISPSVDHGYFVVLSLVFAGWMTINACRTFGRAERARARSGRFEA